MDAPVPRTAAALATRPPLVKGSIIALAWLLFSAFMLLLLCMQNVLTGRPIDWSDALVGRLLYGGVWGLLTPVVFALASRFNLIARHHRLRHLFVHAVASYAFSLAYRLAYAGLAYAGILHPEGVQPGYFSLDQVVVNANTWVSLYWMLLCIAYALRYRDHYREGQLMAAQLETQLVQVQLQALKMQLQPHFLFNAMNAVSALIGSDVKAARQMLSQLSQFLRLVLDGSDQHEVSLEQELRLTRLYLSIEQTRFPDRLAVQYHIDPDTLGALLPALLLQPVVENAVRHGLAPQPGMGQLTVTTQRRGAQLLVQVQDNGCGTADQSARGIGLRNLESRLEALYGTDYTLEIETALNSGYRLLLQLPFRLANPKAPYYAAA